jgi:AcrR family transcriptional regulator
MTSESSDITTRSYRQRKRAENQAETRRRITEAAVDLHGSIGPARTTVSAIADRAGVQRATVYRHFPDDQAMLNACSAHYGERYPRPDRALWQDIADPHERLAAALDALYAWYEQVEPMLTNVTRDVAVMPALTEVASRRLRYLAAVEDELAGGWVSTGDQRQLRAALALALDFGCWRLFQARGLPRADAVALMVQLVGLASA